MPRVYKNPDGYVVDLPEFKVRQREPVPVSVLERGACRAPDVDPSIFFPELGQHAGPAKKVCRTCPVQLSCLHYSVREFEEYGVWGGASERTRKEFKTIYRRTGKLPWLCAVCSRPYVRNYSEATCSELCASQWTDPVERIKLKLKALAS